MVAELETSLAARKVAMKELSSDALKADTREWMMDI